MVLEQHPNFGFGWWWDLSFEKNGDIRVVHGYAFTKWGAVHAAKRRARRESLVGRRIEMDL